MQYMVFFFADEEVVVANEEDVILGEQEGFSLDDWRRAGETRVKVLYGDDCYDACVLQVRTCLHAYLIGRLLIFFILYFLS